MCNLLNRANLIAWAYAYRTRDTRPAQEVTKNYEPHPQTDNRTLSAPFYRSRASTAAMAVSPSLLQFLVLFCALCTVRAQSLIVVRVDPFSGNDSSCLSAQEAANDTRRDQACATINRALGDVGCGKNASCAASGRDRLSGVEIRLADGVHRLTGGLCYKFNLQHQF